MLSSSSSAYSAILRRQQFLLNCLGVAVCSRRRSSEIRMEEAPTRKHLGPTAAVATTQSDAEDVIRRITPPMDPARHKGQAGKVAVIGGCREYTGAPYFAAISALKLGADISHVFCTKEAATVIKSYSPELIVHPLLEESYSLRDDEKASVSDKILSEFTKWIGRFDCLVVGPGLGRDSFLLNCVADILKHAKQSNIPIVIDGDGLFLVTDNLDLIKGYPLAVLTPNVNEYRRLIEKVFNGDVDEQEAPEKLVSLAKSIGGVTILKKGKSDLISDGHTVNEVSIFGSPRRCGGQGDILSGSVAVFSSWAHKYISAAERADSRSLNPMVLGSIAGAAILREAASLAFSRKKRATVTTDIIEHLGESLERVSPVKL